MRSSLVRDVVPYLVVLSAACFLYYRASQIVYSSIPGRLGPDAWPKISIVCLAVVCVIAIIRRIFAAFFGVQASGEKHELLDVGSDEDMEALSEESHPVLVGAAIAATVLFLLVIETAGFFISAFVFIGTLMWLGGVRRALVLLPLCLGCTFFFMFLFQRIIFVALPIGVEPFSKVSTTVMLLIGVH